MPSRFYRVPPEAIGLVRAILEGYDGVATLVSASPYRGEIAWEIGEGLLDEAAEIAARLAPLGLQEIPRPDDWPTDLTSGE